MIIRYNMHRYGNRAYLKLECKVFLKTKLEEKGTDTVPVEPTEVTKLGLPAFSRFPRCP